MDDIVIKVWAFTYSPCKYESQAETISLHWSKEGAERAMEAHKDGEDGDNPYGWWGVQEFEIQD